MIEIHWIRQWMPIRIQFTRGHILIAECVVQGTEEAERVRTAYMNARECGALESRENIREWNVPVGATINAN